jgi:hypothetical protein
MTKKLKFRRKPPIRNSKPKIKRMGLALIKLGKVFRIKKYKAS